MASWQLDPILGRGDHPVSEPTNDIRDKDLRSSNLLEAETYPTISSGTPGSRKDFGLTFNPVLDGRFVVSDETQLTIQGELVEKSTNLKDSANADVRPRLSDDRQAQGTCG